MAASSSVVRPSPTGPQVFISFRKKDVSRNFISFLEPALRKANINVFIYEDENLGADLSNLLKRIEKSEIALVIFSKDYTSSEWCLDELVKIKERKDQDRLTVIPIFYKLEPSLVKHLKGEYGENFRDMKRYHQHQPERTQKWEEALVSIPESIGMPLVDQSDRTDREFINSLIVKIHRLLEHMAVRGNPEPEANRQGGSMVSSMVPARELQINNSKNPKKWAWSWSIINEAPNSAAIEIATMIKNHWLQIDGTFETTYLTPGTLYEAVFVVKLEDDAIGWDQPVYLELKVVQHDGEVNRVDRTANLNDYIGQNWVDILAGVFMAPPENTPATITFTMHQLGFKKKGLVVKGVAIRPRN